VILGAGAAGMGIARLLCHELASRGVEKQRVVESVGVLDSRGLLVEGRGFDEPYKAKLAWPRARVHPVVCFSMGAHIFGVRGTVNGGRDIMATGLWSALSVGAAIR